MKNPYLKGPGTGKPGGREGNLQRAQEMEQLAAPPKGLKVPKKLVGTKTKQTPEQTSFPGIHHEDIG
jgi:hypothetical protein